MMDVVPGLVAAVVAAAPLALAFVVDWQVRMFQREAFGHLRRAARNLRLMAWAIFLYYVGTLGVSWWVGDLPQMAAWPLTPVAVALYIRIGAAILAYALALRVARELYLVTRPGRSSHETMRPV